MCERKPLPTVTEADLLIVMAADAIDGGTDPHHKQWFIDFRTGNERLAGEILKQAYEASDGDPDSFDSIMRVVSYAVHALKRAGEREAAAEGTPPETA